MLATIEFGAILSLDLVIDEYEDKHVASLALRDSWVSRAKWAFVKSPSNPTLPGPLESNISRPWASKQWGEAAGHRSYAPVAGQCNRTNDCMAMLC